MILVVVTAFVNNTLDPIYPAVDRSKTLFVSGFTYSILMRKKQLVILLNHGFVFYLPTEKDGWTTFQIKM